MAEGESTRSACLSPPGTPLPSSPEPAHNPPVLQQPGGLHMKDYDEMQGVLLNLLAQVQRDLTPAQMDEVDRLVTAGSHREVVETVCRFANDGRHPLPMYARAMVFKLA